jgi:hypothetical protein
VIPTVVVAIGAGVGLPGRLSPFAALSRAAGATFPCAGLAVEAETRAAKFGVCGALVGVGGPDDKLGEAGFKFRAAADLSFGGRPSFFPFLAAFPNRCAVNINNSTDFTSLRRQICARW